MTLGAYPNYRQFRNNRLIALNNAEWLCQVCGSKANEVHHIDGSKDNHAIENLLPLCASCHRKVDGKGAPKKQFPLWNNESTLHKLDALIDKHIDDRLKGKSRRGQRLIRRGWRLEITAILRHSFNLTSWTLISKEQEMDAIKIINEWASK